MIKKISLLTIYFHILFLANYAQTPSYGDYHWQIDNSSSDEFNSLNPAKWEIWDNKDHNWPDKPANEMELHVYLNENVVFVGDGYVRLYTRKENYSCPSFYIADWWCTRQNRTGEIYNYTSGWMQSAKQNFLYGYFEIDCNIEYGVATWPAFWTLNTLTPEYEEIDIFEMIPGTLESCTNTNYVGAIHDQYMMTTNLHQTASDPYCLTGGYMVNSVENYTVNHKYGLEWTPNKIIYYIDGKVVRNSPNTGINSPQRVILSNGLNKAVPNFQNAQYPKRFNINYFRYYNEQKDNLEINACTYLFNAYETYTKKSITIGGDGCSNTVPVAGTNGISLRATDFILLQGDFTVPIGSGLYCDVNN